MIFVIIHIFLFPAQGNEPSDAPKWYDGLTTIHFHFFSHILAKERPFDALIPSSLSMINLNYNKDNYASKNEKDSMSDKDAMLNSLYEWIQTNGGVIHSSLTVQNKKSVPSGSEAEPTIHYQSDDCVNDSNYRFSRGVFATTDISKGELLVSVPSKLVISGESWSQVYQKSLSSPSQQNGGNQTSKRQKVTASPWLRCVGAFMSAVGGNSPTEDGSAKTDHQFYTPYINSLPESYDTLLQGKSWPDEDIEKILGGTTLGQIVLHDRQYKTFRRRYEQSIRPYLQSNSIVINSSPTATGTYNSKSNDEDEHYYNLFEKACSCISTRGFHLRNNNVSPLSSATPIHGSTLKNDEEKNYSGPFLLPFIDLLNHSSSSSIKCTTLQRGKPPIESLPLSKSLNKQESFFMIAERDIKCGEEILHSYGDELTSTQLLQTFGFVEDANIQRAVTLSPQEAMKTKSMRCLTPAILSKASIIKACSIVAKSTYPETIRKMLLERPSNERLDTAELDVNDDVGDIDEVWDIPNDVQNRRKDTINVIPDEILIQSLNINEGDDDDHDDEQYSMLSDELVTLCCIQFLPDEAYTELMNENDDSDKSSSICLLEKEVLEDYFLGKLVCKAILDAIEERMNEYSDIDLDNSSIFGNKSNLQKPQQDVNTNKLQEDQKLLKNLMKSNDVTLKKKEHLLYGLTIRIEEKMCLMMLKKEVAELFDSLDDDVR